VTQHIHTQRFSLQYDATVKLFLLVSKGDIEKLYR